MIVTLGSKGPLLFDSLRQACIEQPAARSLARGRQSVRRRRRQLLLLVAIRALGTDAQITLNPGLVAIIGARAREDSACRCDCTRMRCDADR